MKARLLAALGSAAAVAACAVGPGPEFRAAVNVDVPQPDAVDAVVFLVGDAGATEAGATPLLRKLKADVEMWSEALVRDSAVTVLFLGDNVYPVGIRDRDSRYFAQDSARLWSQIDLVAGPYARQRGTAGIFLAGNHDWGNMTGPRGVARLQNQAAQFDSARAQGIPVWLMPDPGDPGPVHRDVRENVRLLLMDTHWFLQEPEAVNRTDFFVRVEEALEEAEDRHVIMAAHHPYGSAGPHGLLVPGARALGLLFLMKKSGTLVQDLNSPIYDRFLARMRATFLKVGRRPLVFAGGHDHSLQVLDTEHPDDPETLLVSGAGSKLTDLAESHLLRYAAARPGYMMLVFRRNEAVDLYVFAGDVDGMRCPTGSPEELGACMTEEAAAYGVVYSERLTAPASLADSANARAPGRSGGAGGSLP